MRYRVLNDILISLGFRSKCVCSIPYDKEDMDTYILVHVYDEANRHRFVADPAMGNVHCDKDGAGMDMMTLRNHLALEDEIWFYSSGKVISDHERCLEYARMLTKNMVMFIVFQNSGLEYDFEKSRIIVPSEMGKISQRNRFAALFLWYITSNEVKRK